MYCFHRASHVPVPSLLDLVYETYWFVPTVLLITLLPEVVDKARTILAPKSTGVSSMRVHFETGHTAGDLRAHIEFAPIGAIVENNGR